MHGEREFDSEVCVVKSGGVKSIVGKVDGDVYQHGFSRKPSES